MIHVLHIISNLDTGGAEMMLFRLVERLDRSKFQPSVLSLTDIGAVGERIRALGVPVDSLDMRRGGMPSPAGFLRLAAAVRRLPRPAIIHTWMYHADLLGGIAANLSFWRRAQVVWGIRHTNLDTRDSKRLTIWTMRACAILSRFVPRRVACNSHESLRLHAGLGYDKRKMLVIPNGFDLDRFKPATTAEKAVVRAELGIDASAFLIGLAARYNPQKDHQNFVRAAAALLERRPETHFLLCGRDITWDNAELAGWIRAENKNDSAAKQFHLLGRRDDMTRLTAALDIATCSSSFGESFPQVLGEAMACAVPCATTDVGDAAHIVGETGKVVPIKNHQALCAAWEELMELPPDEREALGEKARRRARENFSLDKVVRQYEQLYLEIARRPHGKNS